MPATQPGAPTFFVRRASAIGHVLRARGPLGLGRAYVEGSLETDDIDGAFLVVDDWEPPPIAPRDRLRLLGALALAALPAGIPRRPETELLLPGARHSPERDAEAVRYHYDVGNDFFALFLDPSMTYSCALFSRGADTLEEAQRAKLDLIARKLELQAGQRVLDVGCGWGSFAIHAARRIRRERDRDHAVAVTGRARTRGWSRRPASPTVSRSALPTTASCPASRYDAIASIGMAEHVGQSQIDDYARSLFRVLRPGGLVLNHAISLLRPEEDPLADKFTMRYVFPDGEPLLLSRVQLAFELAHFHTEHVEGFTTDYALTLRHWHDRLDEHLVEAERLVGAQRLRVWRLYLRAARHGFDVGYTSVYQLKARRPA